MLVVVVKDVQQSTVQPGNPTQFLLPHTRSPTQSKSLSQSPSSWPHGYELEQHDHMFSWDPSQFRIVSVAVVVVVVEVVVEEVGVVVVVVVV